MENIFHSSQVQNSALCIRRICLVNSECRSLFYMSSKAASRCFPPSSSVVPSGSGDTCVEPHVLEEVPTTAGFMQMPRMGVFQLSQHRTETRLMSSAHKLIN